MYNIPSAQFLTSSEIKSDPVCIQRYTVCWMFYGATWYGISPYFTYQYCLQCIAIECLPNVCRPISCRVIMRCNIGHVCLYFDSAFASATYTASTKLMQSIKGLIDCLLHSQQACNTSKSHLIHGDQEYILFLLTQSLHFGIYSSLRTIIDIH